MPQKRHCESNYIIFSKIMLPQPLHYHFIQIGSIAHTGVDGISLRLREKCRKKIIHSPAKHSRRNEITIIPEFYSFLLELAPVAHLALFDSPQE